MIQDVFQFFEVTIDRTFALARCSLAFAHFRSTQDGMTVLIGAAVGAGDSKGAGTLCFLGYLLRE